MTQQPTTWIVVGLGNPGERYAGTRHNIGAMVTDVLVEQARSRWKQSKKTRSDICQTHWEGASVVLARPHSFMNESGGPISSLLKFFSATEQSLIVIHDELDLPLGALRIKQGGGDNGHNGLRSTRSSLGTGEFIRLRVGIGRPPGQQDTADFVLRAFPAAQRNDVSQIIDQAAIAAHEIVSRGVAAAQNEFNRTVDGVSDREG
ncbi:MAG: aminoacyl-tRNA hydrolase [Actinomycetes bacterium]|jgi:peptidyl-tRNA hydrolase, PTH1 family|nr:aminoacyl-tRNA hydrolase [Candidatus Nanopelagicales bacterium]MDP4825473.1 aminoacyl-tRNA hydrolase [Candidatus Nanopelagicales bacterium]MDP4887915.1 aminoacyl-tRNA hydrolase [Candidatus Nanopelagicales bacterium]